MRIHQIRRLKKIELIWVLQLFETIAQVLPLLILLKSYCSTSKALFFYKAALTFLIIKDISNLILCNKWPLGLYKRVP